MCAFFCVLSLNVLRGDFAIQKNAHTFSHTGIDDEIIRFRSQQNHTLELIRLGLEIRFDDENYTK